MTEPVDFLTVPLANGGSYTRLDRLTDGRIMCQLCFGYFTTDELNPVDGGVEDVCKPCAAGEKDAAARQIVFATQGGRRFHQTLTCRALRIGQELYGGWGTLRTYAAHSTTISDAMGAGKEACAACLPGLRASWYHTNSEIDYGHEPFTYDGVDICARCFIQHRSYRETVLWPCMSAIVLGLVPREVTA